MLATLALLGCSSSPSGDDSTVKSGSGEIVKPASTPETQAIDEGQKKQGAMMNDARAQGAAAEAAARAKSGGK